MLQVKWYVVECEGHDPALVKSHPLHTAACLLASVKARPVIPENYVVRLSHANHLLVPGCEIGGSRFPTHSVFHIVAARPFVGYCRLSTRKQNELYSFAHQRQAIETYVAKLKGIVVEFFEEVTSGRKLGRPILSRALDRCRRTKETLVVSKTDRLCRNTASIVDLDRSGVTYHVAELGVDQPRFMLLITASVAEEESLLISKRTRAALAQRKPHPPRASRIDPDRERWQALDAYHMIHPHSLDAGLRIAFPDQVTVFVDACYRRLRLANVARTTTKYEGTRTPCSTENWPTKLKYKALCFKHLADLPLSTRNWRKIRTCTLLADDGEGFENATHYLGMVCLLPPTPTMRASLAVGKLPEPMPVDEDVARVWMLRTAGKTYKAIGSAIGKPPAYCRTLKFNSLDPLVMKTIKGVIFNQ